MENLIYHFFKYSEVYMFIAALGITVTLYACLFYEFKKYPNLVLEIKNDTDEKE